MVPWDRDLDPLFAGWGAEVVESQCGASVVNNGVFLSDTYRYVYGTQFILRVGDARLSNMWDGEKK